MKAALLLVSTLLLGGGKIDWSKLTVDEALEESKKTGTPVLVYFNDACGFCQQQDKEAFSDDAVVGKSEKFLRVYVDCTKRDERKKQKDRWKFLGTPFVLVLDGEGKRLAEFDGLTPAATFNKKFDEIIAKIPKTGQTPSSGVPEGERLNKLMARLDAELKASADRLREDVSKIVRDELAKAGIAKPAPKEPAVDFDKQLDAFAATMSDEGVTGRFKKFMRTKEGKAWVQNALKEQGIEKLDDAGGMYFEKGKDGKMVLKEEFIDQLAQLLDEVAPEPENPPKDPPKDPPKQPDKKPGYLGIFPAPLSDDERKELGVTGGFRLEDVKKGSPAEKSGLKAGDVLVAIGGKKVSEENMGQIMGAYKAGDDVEITIVRGKKEQKIKVTFGEKP